MTDLSPAAQAVLDAFNREARPEPHHQREAIAAALRAAKDRIAEMYNKKPADIDNIDVLAIDELERIAAELEGAS